MIAAVMCGGLGSRLNSDIEKPLTKLGGRMFVEYVLKALLDSGIFSRIVAVASPNTPKTRQFLASSGIEIIDSAGDGYSSDLSTLLAKLAPDKVLVVPSDTPLLSPAIIKEIVRQALREPGYPAVSIVLDKSFVQELGVKPSVVVDEYCHSGITVFDTKQIGPHMTERYVKINLVEIAVNVNTKEEKDLAEKLLVQRT